MQMINNNGTLMQGIIDKMDSMVRVMDEENNVIYMNERMRKEFGDCRGKKCYQVICKEEHCENCVTKKARCSGSSEDKIAKIDGKVYRIIASPVNMKTNGTYAVEIFEDVTEQIKLEEENEKYLKRLKEDMEFAKKVQYRALPKDGEYFGNLRTTSFYRPAESLAGDIFDVVKIDQERSLFYIADVSGHGIQSSLLTIFLRQVIRGIRSGAENPTVLINEIISNFKELNAGKEQYLTLLAGIYDSTKKNIVFLNAGHNCLPLILRKEGEMEEIKVTGLPVCSILPESNHETEVCWIEPGDSILLYTDGIVEAYSKELKKPFGVEGLIRVIQQSENGNRRKMMDELKRQVEEFADCNVKDDMTAILIEFL